MNNNARLAETNNSRIGVADRSTDTTAVHGAFKHGLRAVE
jgi:hypothetical protein